MAKAIGIDLGTTNSVVAFKDTSVRTITTGPDNEELCRSCVAIDKKTGEFVVGNSPYNSWKKYAPNIVVSVKRLMGVGISDEQVQKMKAQKSLYPYGIDKLAGGTDESVAVILNGKQYTPEQISAQILRQLKDDASVKLGEITHAVITVPAYFNEKQKIATRKAAELAGLKVQRLLAEPTAAAISYGVDKMGKDEEKVFLVYDFGGGTFDLSILVASGGNFIESGTGGDRWLGGDDIDKALMNYVFEQTNKEQNVDVQALIEALDDRKRFAFQGELKKQIDFTANAIGINIKTGTIYDPVHGITDINNRVLRAVRLDFPERPVSSDIPLSAVSVFWFRLLHFQNKLGFEFEKQTKEWIIENAHRIKDIEIFKKYFFTPQISKELNIYI